MFSLPLHFFPSRNTRLSFSFSLFFSFLSPSFFLFLFLSFWRLNSFSFYTEIRSCRNARAANVRAFPPFLTGTYTTKSGESPRESHEKYSTIFKLVPEHAGIQTRAQPCSQQVGISENQPRPGRVHWMTRVIDVGGIRTFEARRTLRFRAIWHMICYRSVIDSVAFDKSKKNSRNTFVFNSLTWSNYYIQLSFHMSLISCCSVF